VGIDVIVGRGLAARRACRSAIFGKLADSRQGVRTPTTGIGTIEAADHGTAPRGRATLALLVDNDNLRVVVPDVSTVSGADRNAPRAC
jgi:hypothetical protein